MIGLVGYSAVGAMSFARGELLLLAAAALARAGAGFSIYLTYLELFVIDAICQWSVASLVVMVALAAVTVTRLLRADRQARTVDGGLGALRSDCGEAVK